MKQPLPTGLRTQRFEQMPDYIRQKELDRLPEELALEKEWLTEASLPAYEDVNMVLGGIATGKVVAVIAEPDMPYRPHIQDRVSVSEIATLAEDSCSVPYLNPRAFDVLVRTARNAEKRLLDNENWQYYLRQNDLLSIQFSITSMLRSRIYQKHLVAKASLALDGDSAHMFGTTFDVDHAGYYVKHRDGKLISVNGLQNSYLYDDSPILAFQSELEEAAQREEVTFITELPEGRGCWHITTNPLLMD